MEELLAPFLCLYQFLYYIPIGTSVGVASGTGVVVAGGTTSWIVGSCGGI